MQYNPQLISFITGDNLKLPGLLYEPQNNSKSVLIYLHGNGSSSIFYGADYMNTIARVLNDYDISFFPFNNRGAHYIKTLKNVVNGEEERIAYGMSYELIKDCVYDIDGAIAYLSGAGYTTFYLAGLSTGANKICVYNKYKPDNQISKYILLSGGDDTGLYYEMLGKESFLSALSKSKEEITKGSGRQFVPDSIVEFPLSYQSLYDTINPDGDYNIFPFNESMNDLKLSSKTLFGEFAALSKPTLVMYGEFDEYCYGKVPECVKILEQHTKDKHYIAYSIIPQADHSFTGKEEEMIRKIVTWIRL